MTPTTGKKVDLDALQEEFETEFRDRASDLLAELSDIITQMHKGTEAADRSSDRIRRRAHSLKGLGGTFGHPLVTLIAHRFEDWLNGIGNVTPEMLRDAQTFIDRIEQAVGGYLDGVSEADIVRQLPGKCGFELSDVTKQDIEVLLIMPRDTSQRIVEREIQACGYRVVTVDSAFEGMEFAVRTRPDVVIAARMLGYISGVDLLCALKAMPATQDMRCLLVTSSGIDDVRRAGLPSAVPIVRKGEKFGEDFADALQTIKLT